MYGVISRVTPGAVTSHCGSGVFTKQTTDGWWSMSRRPSLIYETCARFDDLKAVGVSRHTEKLYLRRVASRQGRTLPMHGLSTGRIHADKTLDTYKGVALRYAHWARDTHGVQRLANLDANAERFVALYLEARGAAGDSAYSLKTTRSALRMFHRPAYAPEEREARVQQLGGDVTLPVRRREGIIRSRGTAAMDHAIALDRYRPLVAFCRATGLRRRELAALTVGAIRADTDSGLVVDVVNGKGGKIRAVPCLPGHEEDVLALAVGRSPDEKLVPHVPVRMDVHAYRRRYAQDLYTENGARALPSPAGRLRPGSVDTARALVVARALGHGRIDIVLRHYLR